MTNPSNGQLRKWAENIRQSDRTAFDDLFRALYSKLVQFATKYMHDRTAACDVVQDAFIALWQKRSELDPDRSLKAYLYKIVRNRALNVVRSHANHTIELELVQDDFFQTEDYGSQIRQQAEPDLLAEKFNKWIASLPVRQREAFELSRFEGLDHEEIADIMNVSKKTVNNHIVAALSKLRNCYEKYQKEVKRIDET